MARSRRMSSGVGGEERDLSPGRRGERERTRTGHVGCLWVERVHAQKRLEVGAGLGVCHVCRREREYGLSRTRSGLGTSDARRAAH